MERDLELTQRIRGAGITIRHEFAPGDLGELIRIHGVQNTQDYGFNAVHEAYCARIASDFIIDRGDSRSKVWIAVHDDRPIGCVFIRELPNDVAQLRLLFADAAFRGIGLGRWLVEASVEYCRQSRFSSVFLWTVEGLDRAQTIYESAGFGLVERKETFEWGRRSVEVRYEVRLV